MAAPPGVGCAGEAVRQGEETNLAFSVLLHTMVMRWFWCVVVLFYEWPLNSKILLRITS